jgi:hypothetical protein
MRAATVAVLLVAAGTGLSLGGAAGSGPAGSALQEECLGCHVGIEARAASFQDLPFPHRTHVSLGGACLRCHQEHVVSGEHAGVRVAKEDCQACHHGSARRGSALCERCHGAIFANSVTFRGRPFNHSVHVGAFTGLECVDCHGAATERVVASPSMEACVGCHP